MTKHWMHGITTALVTPFDDQKLDYSSFESFMDWQIENGITSFVVCGSTGESLSLSNEEKIELLKLSIKKRDICSDIKIIFNCSDANTEVTINNALMAQDLGADALMAVAPYYIRPTQQGLYEHFEAINEAVEIPIIVYNVPKRTGVDIANETIIELAKLSNIQAFKDASGDLSRPSIIKESMISNSIDDFLLLSGEDATAVAFNASGGSGCISVLSNIVPQHCLEIQYLTAEYQYQEAIMKHQILIPLIDALSCEPNPISVKYALYYLNKIKSSELRLPLTTLSKIYRSNIEIILNNLL